MTRTMLRDVIKETVSGFLTDVESLQQIIVGEIRVWEPGASAMHRIATVGTKFKVLGPENYSVSHGMARGGKLPAGNSMVGARPGDVIKSDINSVIIKPVSVRDGVVSEMPEAQQVTVPVRIVRLKSLVIPAAAAVATATATKKQEKQDAMAAIGALIKDQLAAGATEKQIIDILMSPDGKYKFSKYLAKTHITKQAGMMEGEKSLVEAVFGEKV